MDQRLMEVTVIKRSASSVTEIVDTVVRETPLTIYFNKQELVTLLCTPEHLDELAVGFLAAEGLVKRGNDEIELEIDPDRGVVKVNAPQKAGMAEKLFLRRYITTGCGKGTTFYHAMDERLAVKVTSRITVPAHIIPELMSSLQSLSRLYLKTGGVHSAALCDNDRVVLFREDVGRHNAVDKILGRCVLDNISLSDKVLVTSGRISSEILLKVAKMGLPILISRSAPTDLAVKTADELGITVIGFARGKRFNVYTHQSRVV